MMGIIQKLLFSALLLLTSVQAYSLKVGLVLDKGGKDDKSFNSSAYEGASLAQKELGIQFKYVEASDLNALENLHRSFATKDFDLIIGIGFSQTDAIKKIAAQFPQKKFVLVDGEVSLPNVRSIIFEEHEGSYLVGALAALHSKNKIGFIGGMDIPLIRRFEMGFQAGAKKIKSDIKVVSQFIGVTNEAWNNPAKAKELALSQYNAGVDIIFVAAGASGTGAFDAAEEKKKLAIGVDSNQNWMRPGFILTSMLKRVDHAVYNSIKDSLDGKFVAGIHHFGLKNKGVDFSVDQHNEKILNKTAIEKVEKIKNEIIEGKITVPDFYKKGKK